MKSRIKDPVAEIPWQPWREIYAICDFEASSKHDSVRGILTLPVDYPDTE